MRASQARETIFFILIFIAFLALLITNREGLVNFLSYDCRRMAESMQTNYYYHPSDGCFLQQPDGTWRQVLKERPPGD